MCERAKYQEREGEIKIKGEREGADVIDRATEGGIERMRASTPASDQESDRGGGMREYRGREGDRGIEQQREGEDDEGRVREGGEAESKEGSRQVEKG